MCANAITPRKALEVNRNCVNDIVCNVKYIPKYQVSSTVLLECGWWTRPPRFVTFEKKHMVKFVKNNVIVFTIVCECNRVPSVDSSVSVKSTSVTRRHLKLILNERKCPLQIFYLHFHNF